MSSLSHMCVLHLPPRGTAPQHRNHACERCHQLSSFYPVNVTSAETQKVQGASYFNGFYTSSGPQGLYVGHVGLNNLRHLSKTM